MITCQLLRVVTSHSSFCCVLSMFFNNRNVHRGMLCTVPDFCLFYTPIAASDFQCSNMYVSFNPAKKN